MTIVLSGNNFNSLFRSLIIRNVFITSENLILCERGVNIKLSLISLVKNETRLILIIAQPIAYGNENYIFSILPPMSFESRRIGLPFFVHLFARLNL